MSCFSIIVICCFLYKQHAVENGSKITSYSLECDQVMCPPVLVAHTYASHV